MLDFTKFLIENGIDPERFDHHVDRWVNPHSALYIDNAKSPKSWVRSAFAWQRAHKEGFNKTPSGMILLHEEWYALCEKNTNIVYGREMVDNRGKVWFYKVYPDRIEVNKDYILKKPSRYMLRDLPNVIYRFE